MVITELYKVGKRESQQNTPVLPFQWSSYLTCFAIDIRNDSVMTLFDIPPSPERASTRSSSKEIAYRCMVKP